jgi:hypothetical protein
MPTNHVHKYRRRKKNRNIYQCAFPRCMHYCDRFALYGKAAICWGCDGEFILSPYNLTTAQPKCLNCQKTKLAAEYNAGRNFMEGLLNDVDEKIGLRKKSSGNLENAEAGKDDGGNREPLPDLPATGGFFDPEGDGETGDKR